MSISVALSDSLLCGSAGYSPLKWKLSSPLYCTVHNAQHDGVKKSMELSPVMPISCSVNLKRLDCHGQVYLYKSIQKACRQQ
jgi:hypothetical protein